jgi:two-component system phosphate regulon sensor histidine kinase PhoR
VTTSFLRAESEDEEKAGIVVVFKNITEFKALDRARERVLNHLAHELRTPLSIILASFKKLQSSQNERSLERIRRNLARLQDIQVEVEDIVKQGTLKETPEKLSCKSKLRNVRLGEHIQKAVEATRQLSSHRSVALLTRIKDDCRSMIHPDVLDMTLMSLLKNAVENTPDGGEATISIYRQPESVVIEVKDTGVGITEQSQKHIFGGFYHSLETDLYSTQKPYDFGAGGKGLDLLRIKMFGKRYHFKIACNSDRCRYIPREIDACPGSIAKCVHVDSKKQCTQSGGSVFQLIISNKINS